MVFLFTHLREKDKSEAMWDALKPNAVMSRERLNDAL